MERPHLLSHSTSYAKDATNMNEMTIGMTPFVEERLEAFCNNQMHICGSTLFRFVTTFETLVLSLGKITF